MLSVPELAATGATLERYLDGLERRQGDAGLAAVLAAVAESVRIIAGLLGKGALDSVLGSAGLRNTHGEVQTRLDLISNRVMVEQAAASGSVTGLVSEEMSDFHAVRGRPDGRRQYLLVYDPLDGSSNIDVDVSVGTIFSVLPAPRPPAQPSAADARQPGSRQVCAGFALYGPATMLVLTTGDGVDAFTLDRDTGAFLLTHPQLRIPERCGEYAINAANARFWEPPVRRYIAACVAGSSGVRGRDFNTRWIASLVADAFRILTRGGVFLYPADSRRPGRLRLLYEANPIAFLVEQAGGLASTGRERILDVKPQTLHERVPLIFGSREEVELVERYHADRPVEPGFDAALFVRRSLFRA